MGPRSARFAKASSRTLRISLHCADGRVNIILQSAIRTSPGAIIRMLNPSSGGNPSEHPGSERSHSRMTPTKSPRPSADVEKVSRDEGDEGDGYYLMPAQATICSLWWWKRYSQIATAPLDPRSVFFRCILTTSLTVPLLEQNVANPAKRTIHLADPAKRNGICKQSLC